MITCYEQFFGEAYFADFTYRALEEKLSLLNHSGVDLIKPFFINNDMSIILLLNIITQFGGEQAFLDNYLKIKTKGMNHAVSGWIEKIDLLNFYQQNESDIDNFLGIHAYATAGNDDSMQVIADISYLNAHFDRHDIVRIIQNKSDNDYKKVVCAITWFIVDALVDNYDYYINNPEQYE